MSYPIVKVCRDRVPLLLSCRPTLGSGRPWWGLPGDFSSPGWTTPTPSSSPHKRDALAHVHVVFHTIWLWTQMTFQYWEIERAIFLRCLSLNDSQNFLWFTEEPHKHFTKDPCSFEQSVFFHVYLDQWGNINNLIIIKIHKELTIFRDLIVMTSECQAGSGVIIVLDKKEYSQF